MLLSAALAAIAWRVHFVNRRLAEENRGLRAARERPLLIRGAKLDLLSETTPIVENASSGKVRQVLVFALSAACPISQDNVGNWGRLVEQVNWRPDQEVWLISFDTWGLVAPIVQRLKERGIWFRVRRTRDRAVFPYATGIVGVPLTLVLDPEGVVEAVASGKLDAEALEVITSCLNGKGAWKDGRPFLAIEGVNDVRTLHSSPKE